MPITHYGDLVVPSTQICLWQAVLHFQVTDSYHPTTTKPETSPWLHMATRVSEGEAGYRAKRQKTSPSDMDPKSNPYLAHMYEQPSTNGYSNGYSVNGYHVKSPLLGMKRRQTTAAQAVALENGPRNPFKDEPLSQRYFDILRTRRNLPVHAQR